MIPVRKYGLLLVIISLLLSGCFSSQKAGSTLGKTDFSASFSQPVKAGEFVEVNFALKNLDGPTITSFQIMMPDADAVNAAPDRQAKVAGKKVTFDDINLEKDAVFSGHLLVRIDYPGTRQIKFASSAKTDVWQSLEPYPLSVTVEDTEKMKARRSALDEIDKTQANIRRLTTKIAEEKALADSSRGVIAGHEGRIRAILDTMKSLQEAKARAPQSQELTETIAMYDKELAWSRQQIALLNNSIDTNDRAISSLTQAIDTLKNRKSTLENSLQSP